MKGIKKLLVSGLCAAGILLVPGVASAAGNGYVDYNAVISATPAFSQAQKELVTAQQTLQQQFNTQSKGMNDKQKKELAQKLDKQLQAKQLEIQKNEIVPAVNKIRAAIEAAAKKNGIDFVVQESAWLYGGKDLTQEVINQMK
ncbi:OmpH family outer membrane protein [uncultured Dialister sp.]|jgi:outer membrane protein|uniref:OmpH family outer membrane protein n=1 Tax=uncultured Dialister sp. TaxID=278064 RepID=UPI0025D9BBB3|nr:OmpH family outer membrane protein [uncultured Dialister sp.]